MASAVVVAHLPLGETMCQDAFEHGRSQSFRMKAIGGISCVSADNLPAFVVDIIDIRLASRLDALL